MHYYGWIKRARSDASMIIMSLWWVEHRADENSDRSEVVPSHYCTILCKSIPKKIWVLFWIFVCFAVFDSAQAIIPMIQKSILIMCVVFFIHFSCSAISIWHFHHHDMISAKWRKQEKEKNVFSSVAKYFRQMHCINSVVTPPKIHSFPLHSPLHNLITCRSEYEV